MLSTITMSAVTERKLVKPSELDIYHEPDPTIGTSTAEQQSSILYENVSAARRRVTGAFSGLLTTHEKMSSAFAAAETKLTDIYHNTINDPYFLMTPGVITLAAVGGALVAGKGRRPFKRSLFAIVFGGTATVVSYPQRSLEIATTGCYHTTASLSNISNLWKGRKETITEKVLKENEEIDEEKFEEIKEDINTKIKEDANTEVSQETAEEYDIITQSNNIVETLVSETHDVVEILENGSAIPTGVVENTVEIKLDEPVQQELQVVEIGIIEADVKKNDIIEADVKKNDINAVDDSGKNDSSSVDVNISGNKKYESRHIEFDEKSSGTEIEGDYGQSEPSDQDMYSTRSS